MKIGLLTFEAFLGKKDIGSSRIRGHWIVNAWNSPDVELFRFGVKYDCIIFQKAYFLEYAKRFKGIKILDLCDPDWLHWSFHIKEMIDECDAVTCSSENLAKSVRAFTDKPVHFVPDRILLESLPPPKVHSGPTKKCVWFGYSHNFQILDSTIKLLSDLDLELIVISENVYCQPASFKIMVTNLPWSEHYMKDIQSGDIVLNPKYHKGKWRFKSDNKTSLAKALGIPVAHDGDELKALLSEAERKKAAEVGLEEVRKNFDIKLSVEQLKEIIESIKHE